MARSRRFVCSGLVLVLLSPFAASASGIPSQPLCTVPSLIRLVGSSGGVGDEAAGRLTIVVRNLANNPIDHGQISIDFSNCPDVVLCTDQLDPGALVYCPGNTVRKQTDNLGEVTFTILGGSTGASGAASRGPAGRIYCNGVLIGTPSVAVYDLDGVSGLGAADLTAWLTDFASGIPWSRSDYDGSGDIGANDLADWLAEFASGASLESGAASCP